ncbi:hypothetical protein EJ06DRAFT_546551 [Trichodelitschia bisporula]|uniref:F-box domain-containing protein n=1 Tax=Trichodelitschia bisporula TaxID=703511 RepID=A0A6G1I9N0_9PEZI|nr:hypothetical protein EJ06DRAFT_546551 [Trichodelitschia bisporula]
MDLTPIRIRGKRKGHHGMIDKSSKPRGRPVKAQLFQSTKVTQKRHHSSPSPQRHPQAHPSFQFTLRHSRKHTKMDVPEAQLNPLERLPTEILQNVFLMSHNIDLFKCSRCLCQRLSSSFLHREMAVQMLYLTHEEATPLEQSRLIECRFFTWEYFLDLIVDLRKRWLKATDGHPEARGGSKQIQPENYREDGEFLFDLIPPEYLRSKLDVDCDWLDIPYFGLKWHIPYPRKLLRGPWSEGKQKFLWFAYLWKFDYDYLSAMSDAVSQGIRDAIRDRAPLVIRILRLPRINCSVTLEDVNYAMNDSVWDSSVICELIVGFRVLDLRFGILRDHDLSDFWDMFGQRISENPTDQKWQFMRYWLLTMERIRIPQDILSSLYGFRNEAAEPFEFLPWYHGYDQVPPEHAILVPLLVSLDWVWGVRVALMPE